MRDAQQLQVLLPKLARTYRNHIIDMIYWAGAGHAGGSLSAIDLMAYLYEADIDLSADDRSRFILSKGHAVAALYAILHHKGVIFAEELRGFRRIDSRLQGHTDVVTIPETDASSGLLGQGLSIGLGMALGKKLQNSQRNIYVMVGDGELHQGQIWEGIMGGAHYALDNLHLIIDHNKLTSASRLSQVMDVEPLAEKIKAFNWHVEEIDGHDFDMISRCFDRLASIRNRPKCIIAHTVKGKGVSFMEHNKKWHSATLTEEQYAIAKKEMAGE